MLSRKQIFRKKGFREMSQLPNETAEQFVSLLRQKAQSCEFEDAGAVDE